MQETISHRGIVKAIGWIHLILAILWLIGYIMLIGCSILVLVDPAIKAHLDKNTQVDFAGLSVLDLIEYILKTLIICVDVWIAEGLISATDINADMSRAVPLAKQWRYWFIICTIAHAVGYLLVNFTTKAVYSIVLLVIIRGFICAIVHQYIRALENSQLSS